MSIIYPFYPQQYDEFPVLLGDQLYGDAPENCHHIIDRMLYESRNDAIMDLRRIRSSILLIRYSSANRTMNEYRISALLTMSS